MFQVKWRAIAGLEMTFARTSVVRLSNTVKEIQAGLSRGAEEAANSLRPYHRELKHRQSQRKEQEFEELLRVDAEKCSEADRQRRTVGSSWMLRRLMPPLTPVL